MLVMKVFPRWIPHPLAVGRKRGLFPLPLTEAGVKGFRAGGGETKDRVGEIAKLKAWE